MSAAYLNTQKLRGSAIVQTAARHNLREIQAELGADSHINPARTCLNLCLAGPGTADAVASLVQCAMEEAGIVKLRKDAVRAVELLVSLPEDSPIDLQHFFRDALEWVRSFYCVPILSAVVHLDEAAPHMHVLLLPLQNGRMTGSDLIGNRQRLRAMQSDFHETVASRHGLTRPKAEKRLSRAMRDKAARMALEHLQAHPERLMQPNVCLALTAAIAASPEPIVAALGLSMPTGKPKPSSSFVGIMTKPVKPEPKQKPIGFAKQPAKEKSNPYPCVGFAQSPATTDATSPPLLTELTRHRDCDETGIWDEERGEYFQVPVKRFAARRGASNFANDFG